MASTDLLAVFVGTIDRLGLTYMVTGGVASVFYGDPRFTRDVDLVIDLDMSDIASFAAAFDPADYYVPPVETLETESRRRPWGHFNLIHHDTGLRADVYVHADDELEAWALSGRVRADVGEASVWFAPPEYVIVRKLEYYRDSGSDRHLRDIAMMLQVSGPGIDRPELQRWVKDRGLSREWNAALAFEP